LCFLNFLSFCRLALFFQLLPSLHHHAFVAWVRAADFNELELAELSLRFVLVLAARAYPVRLHVVHVERYREREPGVSL